MKYMWRKRRNFEMQLKRNENIATDWFSREEVNYLSDLEKMKPDIQTLSELVKNLLQISLKKNNKEGIRL